MKKKLFFLTFTIIIATAATTAFAGDDAPQWLRAAAAQSVPTYEKDVPAVVLLDDQQVSLSSGGVLTTTENYAVKILNKEGRDYAAARAFYLVSSGKVRDIDAWVIRPDGTVRSYDKRYVVDLASDPDDVYNEYRLKVINGRDDVDTGYVFGYSIVQDETPLFYQDTWGFQSDLPTLLSRYSLSLPAGWTASSTTFNTPDLKPRITGNTYTWQMQSLDRIADEPMSPSAANLSPRIVINYGPASQAADTTHSFADWKDVSRWMTAMHDPQVIVDDAVAGKARDLTAGAKTELEQIRAIGAYVQSLQYISIDIGVGYGNGYRPRSSSLVLGRGYGDCKDKANLMRALLRSIKIDAFPVSIYSGDPTFVRESWPSPRQFNHCIIAIRVGDQTNAASIITDKDLGRLLIFDPTDPYTAVGDLPDYLQNSFAVVAAGDRGGLLRMPLTPVEANYIQRTVNVSLAGDGAIKGSINEHAIGSSSSLFRSEVRRESAADYRKGLEGWLTRGASAAQLVDFKTDDKASEGSFDLNVDFAAPGYGQLMQGRLLVFKPAIVGRRREVFFTETKRRNPIELDQMLVKETAAFDLPAGFDVDETPDAVSLDTPFGNYSTTYKVEGRKLIFSRSFAMKRMLVPVEKYAEVKAFFAKIRDAEQSPVVLVKK